MPSHMFFPGQNGHNTIYPPIPPLMLIVFWTNIIPDASDYCFFFFVEAMAYIYFKKRYTYPPPHTIFVRTQTRFGVDVYTPSIILQVDCFVNVFTCPWAPNDVVEHGGPSTLLQTTCVRYPIIFV